MKHLFFTFILLLTTSLSVFTQGLTPIFCPLVDSFIRFSDTTGNLPFTFDPGDYFGQLSSIGDWNGDGIPEIAVGSYWADGGGSNRGVYYILYMNSSTTIDSFHKISDAPLGGFTGSLADGDKLGSHIVAIGDINKDGVIDLAVGQHGDDDGGTDAGGLWIMFMNANGTIKGQQEISGTQGNFNALDPVDNAGYDISAIGDYNGDGIPDVSISATADDDGGTNRGALYILYLDTTGEVKSYHKISDTQGGFTAILDDNDALGRHAYLGDIDNNGIGDFAVGAFRDDDGGTDRGAVYILFMDTGGTVKSFQKISSISGNFTGPLSNGDNFGSDVEAAGDLDGNGTIDILVSSVLDDGPGNNRGAFWIIFLNANGTVKDFTKINELSGNFAGPLQDGDLFGSKLAFLGDLNGDGITEIGVGALATDDGGPYQGAFWILFLKDTCPNLLPIVCPQVNSHQKISDTEGNFTGILREFYRNTEH